MQSLLTLIQDPGSFASLPAAGHILAGVGVVAGLMFWLMGRRLLKGSFAMLGGVAGAMGGFFLLPTMTDSLFGVPSPYLGIGIGGVLGLAIGIALFRFAVAITTGLAFGLAGAMIAAVYIHFAPATTMPAFQTPALNTPIEPAQLTAPSDRIHQAIEAAKPIAHDVADFVSARASELRTAWEQLPTHEQLVLALAGLGAAAAGFFLGFLAPQRSSAGATALAGSAVWMGCAMWLAEAANLPGSDRLNNAVVWLPAWLLIAAAGFVLQTRGLWRKKKPA